MAYRANGRYGGRLERMVDVGRQSTKVGSGDAKGEGREPGIEEASEQDGTQTRGGRIRNVEGKGGDLAGVGGE